MTTIYGAPLDALVGHENREVVLRFDGAGSFGNEPYDESAVFLRMEGDGEDRRAVFHSKAIYGSAVAAYDWEAYRLRGEWVTGAVTERLSVARLEVED